MISSHQREHRQDRAPKPDGLRRHLTVLLVVVGLVAATTVAVGAQESNSAQDPQSDSEMLSSLKSASAADAVLDLSTAGTEGTCADLGMSVVEPLAVGWESSSDPALNPNYMWAYGDVDLLWDDSYDDYWFHWFEAVPGPDAHVVYQFEPGTTIGGVQFTNDWSDADLLVTGLNDLGRPVSGTSEVSLSDPFVSHAASLNPVTVSAMKMTTSNQQAKIVELDFCGERSGSQLNLAAATPACESITANWATLPGATNDVTVVDADNNQVGSLSGAASSYGPEPVAAGSYTITVTSTSGTESVTESATVTVRECSGGTDCGFDNDTADSYCDSINVIDSFGDAPLPPGADAGMQWNTVREYYDAYGDRPDMCDIDVHNSYWTAVRSTEGALTYYPSWHPPVHDPGGPQECLFTHEHGLDPRTSDIYDEDHPTNIGAPFGFVHPATGGHGGRIEDHVGHKIVVENNLQLTTNNPYQAGITLNLFTPNGQPVTCDWYSKLHQGTHSTDALGFNLHEYYLNYSCDDGTEIRVKEMTDFGFRSPGDSDVASPSGLSGGSGTVSSDCGWFATNLPAPAQDPDPSPDSDFGDAKRAFTCLLNDAKMEELWKASAYISAPDGAATVAYDPYYVVMNPNRYAIFQWWDYLDRDGDHVGENAMISMVDFCVGGTELRNELMRPEAPGNFVKAGANYPGQFRVGTYCDLIAESALDQWAQDITAAGGDNATLMAQRKLSADNVFVGTRRGVHVKGPVVYGDRANFKSLALFCSDHLGNASTWPTNPDSGQPVTADSPWSIGDPIPTCDSGVPQILSTFNNEHGPVEGSTAGASAGLQSNGPAGEIIIDIDALYPDHGVQAPN